MAHPGALQVDEEARVCHLHELSDRVLLIGGYSTVHWVRAVRARRTWVPGRLDIAEAHPGLGRCEDRVSSSQGRKIVLQGEILIREPARSKSPEPRIVICCSPHIRHRL